MWKAVQIVGVLGIVAGLAMIVRGCQGSVWVDEAEGRAALRLSTAGMWTALASIPVWIVGRVGDWLTGG
jgi:hypothetical protein